MQLVYACVTATTLHINHLQFCIFAVDLLSVMDMVWLLFIHLIKFQ